MKTIKWFDRKFDFNFGMEQFSDLLERLEKSASKFIEITSEISNEDLNFKPDGTWSIKEHIGHLYILEPLWQKRFLEIKENKKEMSPADLNNSATDNALFNQYNIEKIIDNFWQERNNTIQIINSFSELDFLNSSYHPRLQQPMRMIDLMYFVAEHDTHHLKNIQNIITSLQQIQTALTPNDIQLCERVILELRPHLKGKNLWQLYQKQLQEKYQILYIKEQGEAVAFVGYRILNMFYSGKTLYIDDLCTLPSSRVRGFAGKLLDKIFEIAKSEQCDVVSLDSGHHRHEAHRLYLNHGFVISSHHFHTVPTK